MYGSAKAQKKVAKKWSEDHSVKKYNFLEKRDATKNANKIAHVTIKDFGPGIPKSKTPKVPIIKLIDLRYLIVI
jgi:hypothetical protein